MIPLSLIMEKNNTWNIRRLVDETFVTSAQQTNTLYSRLTDFVSSTLSYIFGTEYEIRACSNTPHDFYIMTLSTHQHTTQCTQSGTYIVHQQN